MKLLLLSTSTVHGAPYLEYCNDLLNDFYSGIKKLLFIPYARPSGITHDEYTQKASERFSKMGLEVTGLHTLKNDKYMLGEFEAVFTGGGNTFLLLSKLYQFGLIEPLRDLIKTGKMQYMGTSAGSNIAGLTINTTNDMPIVYPPSFDSLGLVPFNLNPHYLDPDPNSKHRGETRETRLNEFHRIPDNNQAVVGLREGSGLLYQNQKLTLTGDLKARLFEKEKSPVEYQPGSDLTFLLK